MRLHGYFRSTAAWRVRIALNLKGIQVEHAFHHLRHGGQRAPEYTRLNPQGLVPALETDDGAVLTQSLAICEWLDETHPTPPLLPGGCIGPSPRPRLRPCDRLRHPSRAEPQSLGATAHNVAARSRGHRLGALGDRRWAWSVRGTAGQYPRPILLRRGTNTGDVCLVPQLYNGRRFGCDLSRLSRLLGGREGLRRPSNVRGCCAGAPRRCGVTQGCARIERKSHVRFR